MSAATRDRLGGAPGGDDITHVALAERFRRPDPPVGAPPGAPGDDQADDRGGAPTDAPADARARESADTGTGGPVEPPDGLTPTPEGDAPQEAPRSALRGVESPRRVLEVKTRAYKGGLRRLEPRAEALADAIRAVLATGAPAAEVRRFITEIGLEPEELPRQARDALRRR